MYRSSPLRQLFSTTANSTATQAMSRPLLVITIACALAGCTATQDGVPTDNSSEPLNLSEITTWGYQIQGIDNDGAVDALVESHYDMLVLEPTRTDVESSDFDTPAMVARLKESLAGDGEHRKLVIAYIDIGEAEDWRWYWTWSSDWTAGEPRPEGWPDYILTIDPDGWEGNYPLAYWDDDWKDIIIYGENQETTATRTYTSVLDEVLDSGFDGVYLDWVEGFENEQVIEAATLAGLDPAEEMITFISEIRAYARERNPDFLIIQQNAAALLEGRPHLANHIDAIAQEGVWYDGVAGDDWNDIEGYFMNDTELTDEYLDFLSQYQDAGVPVFNCEYALEENADDAYNRSIAEGYIPYVSRRSLSRLTDTLGPNY